MGLKTCVVNPLPGSFVMRKCTLGTFRLEDEDCYKLKFSVLSMRTRFGGQHFSKCASSERKTPTGSCPCSPI